METMNQYVPERRHLSERRANVSSSGVSGATGTSVMNAIDWLAMALLIIGGLNWGMVGLFDFDLVATLFGEGSAISRAIYALVGLSALYSIYTATKMSQTNL